MGLPEPTLLLTPSEALQHVWLLNYEMVLSSGMLSVNELFPKINIYKGPDFDPCYHKSI